MPIEKTGHNRRMGDSETGGVFEQSARIIDPGTGRTMTVRCVTVKVCDGEAENGNSGW